MSVIVGVLKNFGSLRANKHAFTVGRNGIQARPQGQKNILNDVRSKIQNFIEGKLVRSYQPYTVI